jgi:hypothetical protein
LRDGVRQKIQGCCGSDVGPIELSMLGGKTA